MSSGADVHGGSGSGNDDEKRNNQYDGVTVEDDRRSGKNGNDEKGIDDNRHVSGAHDHATMMTGSTDSGTRGRSGNNSNNGACHAAAPPSSSSAPQQGAPSSLYRLLTSCKAEKGDDFTHTSFLRPRSSLYVPASFRHEFTDAYCEAMRRGEDLYLTERHRVIGPVLIDLDFRLPSPSPSTNEQGIAVPPTRSYTEEHIRKFAACICRCVSHYVAAPKPFEIFVLEKSRPTTDSKTGLVKDGIHFVVPDIVTRPVAQYIIRETLLHDREFVDGIASLRPVNDIQDVVDKAVIENANWMMYGSKKPGSEPYIVTHVYAYRPSVTPDTRDDKLTAVPVLARGEHWRYVDRLSIRNKFTESPLRPDTRHQIDAAQSSQDEKQRKKAAIRRVLASEPNERQNTSDCYETVKKIVHILNPARKENYNDWIRLGWCLRNIDHRLVDVWEEFSRSSDKYVEGECHSLWRIMQRGGLGMGTLHMWAKNDNPEAYREIVRNDLFDLIQKSMSGTHHDVARVVHHMYKYEYACSNIKRGEWYEFRDHRWVPCDSVHTLRIKISTEVFREYIKVCAFHNQAVMREDADESEQAMHADKSAKLSKLAMQLKVRPFKENVVKECCELFYQERFEELLDSNPGLLAFNNGVYDLDNFEFREGRPDDFVSFCTNIDYIPFDKDHECVRDLQEFWRRVHPNDNIRRYVLTLLASFLSGHTHEERFHIWTGTGSNGKSKVIELYEMILGDYGCKLPVTLLTGKRAASNAASSEVARAKGKRFACLQEPSEDEKLNVGLMKELSGGDTIVTRALFKDPIQFKPMFKMLLLCNHLPNVPSDDGGTWRRIRLVEFASKFVPNPTKENEFPMDIQIGQKFKQWAPHFMSMLIEIYKETANAPIFEPAEVLACTREYQKNNDYYADFVDTCIERVNDTSVYLTIQDILHEFKDWIHNDNIPIKPPQKKEVHSYMLKHLGKSSGPSGNPIFRGFRIRDRYSLSPEDEHGGGAAHKSVKDDPL